MLIYVQNIFRMLHQKLITSIIYKLYALNMYGLFYVYDSFKKGEEEKGGRKRERLRLKTDLD